MHIKLNFDQVMRWVRYIDANEATIHELSQILRKNWLKAAQELKKSRKSNKKSKNKDIKIPQFQLFSAFNIYI
jgi:hypothetical protein